MPKRKWTDEEIDEYRRLYNSYFFYYNKEDANLLVPRSDVSKMFSLMGITFNWAHTIAKIFTLVILALILCLVFMNMKYGVVKI